LAHLPASLEAIASGGPDVVYMGELAERIIEYSSTLGGWLTHDDLREHRGEWTDPISTRHRHIELLECPPNGQGIAALVAAAILDGFDPFGVVGTPEWTHLVVEATKLGLGDAFATVGADDGGEAALACLDPHRIANVRSGIDPARAVVPVPFVPLGAPRDTAYVAVADEHGNGASMISSLFHGFGSGLVVPGTGVILHNRGSLFSMNPHHPSGLRGGARPFHTIISALALRDGRLSAVFGVVGGFQQARRTSRCSRVWSTSSSPPHRRPLTLRGSVSTSKPGTESDWRPARRRQPSRSSAWVTPSGSPRPTRPASSVAGSC
jgi:gamma-glutamyltranspeptidase/glutathione hydrolase